MNDTHECQTLGGKMPLDLIIRGGTVVDGSGAPAHVTATSASTMAASSRSVRSPASRRREIDARADRRPGVRRHPHPLRRPGHVGQRLQPSSGHGVTTVVAGNCGLSASRRAGRSDREMRSSSRRRAWRTCPASASTRAVVGRWESIAMAISTVVAERPSASIHIAAVRCAMGRRLGVAMGGHGCHPRLQTTERRSGDGLPVAEGICWGVLASTTPWPLSHRIS